jgi:hypothetical protein
VSYAFLACNFLSFLTACPEVSDACWAITIGWIYSVYTQKPLLIPVLAHAHANDFSTPKKRDNYIMEMKGEHVNK